MLAGAFSLFAPATSEAGTTLWSGTLTVSKGGTYDERGCGGNTDSACSAQLTDSLTIDGKAYVITDIAIRNWNTPPDLRLGFTRKNPEAGQHDAVPGKSWARLTLQLDGESFHGPDTFDFNDAHNHILVRSWKDAKGISWTAGQKVQVSVIYNDLPSVPRNVGVTRGDDQVTLNWDAPSSWGSGTAGRYEIQWRLRNNFASSADRQYNNVFRDSVVSAYFPEAPASSFVFSGKQQSASGFTLVTSRNPYDFRIRAVSADPRTSGEWVEVISEASAPHAAPTGLGATPGNGQLSLGWNAIRLTVPGQVGGAPLAVLSFDVHYTSVLDRRLLPDTAPLFDNPPGFRSPSAGWVQGPSLSRSLQDLYTGGWVTYTLSGFTDGTVYRGLTPGTTYRVRVRARNDAGGGDWAFVTGTTLGAVFTPSADALVSNFKRPYTGNANLNSDLAQAFTTGSAAFGYSLRTIETRFGAGTQNDLNVLPQVELWSASGGVPNAKISDLRVHSPVPLPRNARPVSLTTRAKTTLASNTTYFVVFRNASGKIALASTNSDNEDPGAAPGWSIANSRHFSNGNWQVSGSGLSLQIRVNGSPAPATVSLSASPNPVREGSPVTVTATLSGTLSEDVSIPIAAASVAKEIRIAAGQTTGTYVHTAGDAPDGKIKREQMVVENRLLKLMRPTIKLGDPYLVNVQVLDENADPPRVSVSDASGTEMENGYPRLCFAFTLDRAASHEIWVNYWTEDGTATAGLDYRGITHPLAIGFDPGETRKEKCISILDDNVEDSGETFYMVLGNPPHGAILGRDRGTGTIYNHEPTSLSALTAEGASGEEGPFTALDIGSFAPATTAYAATVPHGTTHARLTPKSLNPHLTITTGLDGEGKSQVSSGQVGPAVALAVGENVLVVNTQFNGQRQTYTVTVTRQAKPAVASAIADISSLEVGASQEISLSGVFTDADGDALTLSAASSNDAVSTVTVAADYSTLTLAGKAAGTATITVTAQDPAGNQVSDAFDVTVVKANSAPTVASAISDATIANESGTHQVSLSGVFADADQDSLTITAKSSATAIATVSVAPDQTSLTVSAKKRGTCRFSSCPWMQGPATITVTANDGNGGSVDDSFTVTVKAAPTVASAIADLSELEVDATHNASLSGVFNDADGDSLTVTANSSNDAVAAVSVAADHSGLTLTGKGAGTATITVTAQDSDGNTVSDAFDVTVIKVNNPPTVSSAIADATIVNQSGTHQVSLSGVFSDADSDNLTITAESSSTSVATATVSADYSTLTVSAQSRGTTTITVTAADGNGGSVEDTFTVTVKAAPVVASAIADVSELEIEATHAVSMSGVFSDADGDALVIGATTSDSTVAQVSNTIDPSTGSATAITVIGVAAGTVTITVTARDSDGNSVSDAFDVTVPAEQQQGAALPGPVTSLTVTASADDSVTVSWQAPATGGAPDGYIVHLRPEDGEKGSGKTKRPKAKKTQVKFNNLQSGQTYQVWARAQNEAGKGERVHATITLPE